VSGQLASWVGEHSRASWRGKAVLNQYALASHHDGRPAADITREDWKRRTGHEVDTLVRGRNEVLGRPTKAGGREEIPGLDVPELVELEAPGGRGKVGSYQLLVYLCPKWVKCWSCDALAKVLKRARPKLDAEYVIDPETVAHGDSFEEGKRRPRRRISSGDGSRNRRPRRPTTSKAVGELQEPPTEQPDPDGQDRTDGERPPRQQPALRVAGDEPPSPTPPHSAAATKAAAEGRVRTPATAATGGRAPPSAPGRSVRPAHPEPTQGDEMASSGETHEQTSLHANGGPGPHGEERGLDPARAEAAVLVGAVAGSTHAHPDGGDRGRALYRGEGGVPWPAQARDEPGTRIRTVAFDAHLVPLAVVLAEQKRERRRQKRRRQGAAA
jgi:hypothetical protein